MGIFRWIGDLFRRRDAADWAAEARGLLAKGKPARALAAAEKAVALAPEDPNVRYNLACSLALLGRTELALSELERAHELGYDDAAHMLADADLASLRSEARFRRLVQRLGGEPASP